jgi:hypothetical protein
MVLDLVPQRARSEHDDTDRAIVGRAVCARGQGEREQYKSDESDPHVVAAS